MSQIGINRRHFLRHSAIGASALALGFGERARAASPSKDVVIGFIGVGGRGTRLLKYTTAIEGIRIGAVCDLLSDRVARAQVTAKDHKPRGYTDFREMLEKEKLDGVIVATEVANHAKCVIPVLEAGLHCFSEKPMDSTVEKVDTIVNAARKAKCIYQVGFQRRYNESFIKQMEKLHGGQLGKIAFLAGDWQFPSAVGGWVINVEMSGGKLVEQACHHMDVMSWVMQNQRPLECVGMAAITVKHQNPPRLTAEDHSSIIFRFPGDVVFTYTHTSYCPEQFVGEKLWVYGEKWGVNLSKGLLYTPDGKSEQIADESDYYRGEVEELTAFADNIRKGGREKVLSNAETGRVSTLMALMGTMAFRDLAKNRFEPRIVKWEDLGSTTEKTS